MSPAVFVISVLFSLSCARSTPEPEAFPGKPWTVDNHSIRYYMYNESRFLHGHIKTKLSPKCNHALKSPFISHKHDHYNQAVKYFKIHPWRVFDKSSAEIFFVPVPLDTLVINKCSPGDVNIVIAHYSDIIKQEKYYSIKKHFIIMNHFKIMQFRGTIRKKLPDIIIAGFETPHHEHKIDCEFGLGYTTFVNENECENVNINRSRDIMVNFVGQVDRRSGYNDRLALFNSSKEDPFCCDVHISGYGVGFMGTLSQCRPPLSVDRCQGYFNHTDTASVYYRSNFTLCFRGDTLGSDRWQNAMAGGSVPIGVGNSMDHVLEWVPFKDYIPWENITIFIPRSLYLTNPVQVINNVITSCSEDSKDIHDRRILMKQYRPDHDWHVPYSRVGVNILRQVREVTCNRGMHNVTSGREYT